MQDIKVGLYITSSEEEDDGRGKDGGEREDEEEQGRDNRRLGKAINHLSESNEEIQTNTTDNKGQHTDRTRDREERKKKRGKGRRQTVSD